MLYFTLVSGNRAIKNKLEKEVADYLYLYNRALFSPHVMEDLKTEILEKISELADANPRCRRLKPYWFVTSVEDVNPKDYTLGFGGEDAPLVSFTFHFSK